MSSDDQDQPQDRGNNDKPTRDAKGRWLPGYCPNPEGRPKKKPKVFLDQSDIRVFGQTMINITVNGQTEWMERRTALNNKIFEDAMKGKVSMQRFLYQEFAKNDKLLAATINHYDQMMLYWYFSHPDIGKRDFDIPIEVELEILGLRAALNHYFPGNYPPNGIPENNDRDDDDG